MFSRWNKLKAYLLLIVLKSVTYNSFFLKKYQDDEMYSLRQILFGCEQFFIQYALR